MVSEDIIVEIVKPGTGEPVGEGEVGEIVVTTLDPDHPWIRLAIGDLTAALPAHSPCGRTNLRIKGWMGRADQTTKVKGMFVRPEQIAEIGKRHGELARLRLVVTRENEQADPLQPGTAIALALEIAALVQPDSAARRSDVVISGPASDSTAVRLTSSVISELIHDSRQSLLVVSFAAFGVTEVVRELERAARRGVRIDLILESTADQGGTLHGPVGASAAFEAIRQDATFWAGPKTGAPW